MAKASFHQAICNVLQIIELLAIVCSYGHSFPNASQLQKNFIDDFKAF
jgi:hypothetical protein